MVKDFNSCYGGKKVLITGNTGFKGSWLTQWLIDLGADIYGLSNSVPTNPSMFEILSLEKNITQYWGDIEDYHFVRKTIGEIKPDFIFHFAAQALVGVSYSNPWQTIQTNVMGGASVLEAIRHLDTNVTLVFITSDKAYENVEQIWGYRECDRMGGKDIYSSSKGAMDIIARSYYLSFLRHQSNIRFGIARAGNVIGGGDWAKDRVIVDCVNAWQQEKSVEIRSPKATRPWQHVLEPLSGYLRLGQCLSENKLSAETINDFNFGPNSLVNQSVIDLIDDLSKYIETSPNPPFIITGDIPFEESQLLKLNCEKALSELGWQPTLSYEETVAFTGDWYNQFIKGDLKDLRHLTKRQINTYSALSKGKFATWI